MAFPSISALARIAGRVRSGRSVLLAAAAVAVFGLACDSNVTTPSAVRELSPYGVPSMKHSPLEGNRLSADVELTLQSIDDRGKSEVAPPLAVHLQGAVVRGTGYLDLSPVLSAASFIPGSTARLSLPVIETDAGKHHGGGKRIHGAGRSGSGKLVGVDLDPANDNGPTSAIRVYSEGALVYSMVPDWKRTNDGWELRHVSILQFADGRVTRKADISVGLNSGHKSAMIESHGAMILTGAAMISTEIGKVVADALLPTSLQAQIIPIPSDTTATIIEKGVTVLGGAIAFVGAVTGSAAATVGGIFLATLGAAFGFGWYVGAVIQNNGAGGEACGNYRARILTEDFYYWDEDLEERCFGGDALLVPPT